MSEAMDDDIPSSDSSEYSITITSEDGSGYIADGSEGANSADSGDISMTNGEGEEGDAGDDSEQDYSPTPYIVYNLQTESQNLPALEEVLNQSKHKWLYSQDVAHICNFPSDLTLTKQTIKFYNQGLYLFHKWTPPDEYNWEAISEILAKKTIGPFATGVRTTLYRRVYQLSGSLQSEYVLVHYRVSYLDDSITSCDDSGISVIVLDSDNSNGDHTSDEDFIGEGNEDSTNEQDNLEDCKNHSTKFLQTLSLDDALPGTISNNFCHPKNDDFSLYAHAGNVILIGFSPDEMEELAHEYEASTNSDAAQLGTFMKYEDQSETSSSHGGVTAPGPVSVAQLPELEDNVSNSLFFC
ncbi:unnamed protein product [Arabis nemorensis]|uniref:Uncharacterized protein n=1 Tax=Arabis nemorensis TaxID=586526 RepID=A0A565CMI6_9BRAS|nr:unnamed protein product [Arabis nemorensis]